MDNEQLKSFIRRWGPDILSGLASVGVGVTAYLSGRAALRAAYKSSKKEKAKCYIWTALSGVATLASIWGSRRMSAGQLASVTAAAGYLLANRKKIAEYAKEHKIDLKEVIKPDIPVSVEHTGNGEIICLESYSGRFFTSSEEAIEQAEKDLDILYHHGFEEKGYCYASLNEFYHLLGIQTTFFGDQVSWKNEINGEHLYFYNHYVELPGGKGTCYVIESQDGSFPTMDKEDY